MSTTKNIFTVLPLAALVAAEAWANDPVNFVKRSWDDVGKRVVEKDTSITDYFTLNGTASKDDYTLDRDIPYVVKKSFGRYKVVVPKNAVVNLVICDGATLEGGIDIDEGATLNIFAQSDGDNMGKIVAQRLGPSAGIKVPESASLFIHGGDIDAKGGDYGFLNEGSGPGIGGMRKESGGSVTIYAGKVSATGGKDAAGIGNGEQWRKATNGGSLTVYGGTVTARGGEYGAGIGGGQDASGSKVVIYGGTVKAYGGTDAAGIGSGEEYVAGTIDGGSLTVYGGYVYAEGKDWGAGIGGGQDAKGAKVEIYGGTVEAKAGEKAAKENGSAFGSAAGEGYYGSLFIDGNMIVKAGQSTASVSQFPFETRVPACRWRPFARIEPDAGKALKKSAVAGGVMIRDGKLEATQSVGRHADRWFDLQGRKLNGKPTEKGKYLHNGRVEVIR